MNNKGFTLIELLAVLVVLALLAVIAFPNVTKMINDAKTKTKTVQFSSIKEAAKTYVAKHALELGDTNTICISDLKADGLLENTKIIDPKTNVEYTGCFTVKWNTTYNQYTYTYNE